ncbi:MAG: hypothetical protein KAJ55_06615 [Anaerolineales bacterium]|nr:hypothetical protein [Anaerolineales bacterium]
MEPLHKVIGLALDKVAVTMYGMSRGQALERYLCLKCKEKVFYQILSADEIEAYKDTALCPTCYRDILRKMLQSVEPDTDAEDDVEDEDH